MIINVTADVIAQSVQGTLECPVFRALIAAGLNVHMVGCGIVHDNLAANAYITIGEEALLQRLPSAVAEAIKTYDKTGKMEPMTFELPDL